MPVRTRRKGEQIWPMKKQDVVEWIRRTTNAIHLVEEYASEFVHLFVSRANGNPLANHERRRWTSFVGIED
jgi:hypothetical protein